MIYRLSLLVLLFTMPLLPSTPYMGIPLWAWGSVMMSLLYAILLIFSIEDHFKDSSNDG